MNKHSGTVTTVATAALNLETFLKDRRIDEPLAVHIGLKEHAHEQIGPAVAIPYKRGGKTYAYKFRTLAGKGWRSTPNVSRGLFNEDCLEELGPVVITEGELDAMACMQAGFMKSVSLPDGWTIE